MSDREKEGRTGPRILLDFGLDVHRVTCVLTQMGGRVEVPGFMLAVDPSVPYNPKKGVSPVPIALIPEGRPVFYESRPGQPIGSWPSAFLKEKLVTRRPHRDAPPILDPETDEVECDYLSTVVLYDIHRRNLERQRQLRAVSHLMHGDPEKREARRARKEAKKRGR